MSKINIFTIIKSPRLSSKAEVLNKGTSPKLVINVDLKASKVEIKKSLQQLFGVKVESVNTIISKGKVRSVRGGKGSVLMGSLYKKAIVTLAEGQSLEGFDVASGDASNDFEKAAFKDAAEIVSRIDSKKE